MEILVNKVSTHVTLIQKFKAAAQVKCGGISLKYFTNFSLIGFVRKTNNSFHCSKRYNCEKTNHNSFINEGLVG